jgi:hypothetical protein
LGEGRPCIVVAAAGIRLGRPHDLDNFALGVIIDSGETNGAYASADLGGTREERSNLNGRAIGRSINSGSLRVPTYLSFGEAQLKPRGLPGSLEILIDPGRWALVLIHIRAEGELKMPIPVGFLAANPTMVANIQATVRAAVPVGDSWQLLWSATELSQKAAVSQDLGLLEPGRSVLAGG